MSCYQHILLAADFTEHGHEVADKAKQLSKLHQSKLSIIHILDNIPITNAAYGPIIPFDGDLTEQLMASAQTQLTKIAMALDIADNDQYIEVGSPKLEIVRLAKQNNVDLIVVGSHGRHGLALLLGSTANGVLHHAECDVLAVRLKND
jgi:universal stress protein A